MLILSAGLTAATDLGRFEGPPMGFSVNGALDQWAARVANTLVGNHENAPLLEITASKFSFRAEDNLLVAVTGAAKDIQVDQLPVPDHTPFSVRTGQVVTVNPSRLGLRSYLAVHGSFEVPLLLGSCAPDSMLGFGLRLEAGQHVKCKQPQAPLRNPAFELPLVRLGPIADPIEAEPIIQVTDGPDIDEFGDTAQRLFEGCFVVGSRSNHMGLRLAGKVPERIRTDEVLSRGVPVGAIEVPSTQELLVLHRGRGVTAGYPVLAVLTGPSLDAMAQAVPGQRIRFSPTTLEEASLRQLDQYVRLTKFRERCWEILLAHGVTHVGVGLPEADGPRFEDHRNPVDKFSTNTESTCT